MWGFPLLQFRLLKHSQPPLIFRQKKTGWRGCFFLYLALVRGSNPLSPYHTPILTLPGTSIFIIIVASLYILKKVKCFYFIKNITTKQSTKVNSQVVMFPGPIGSRLTLHKSFSLLFAKILSNANIQWHPWKSFL